MKTIADVIGNAPVWVNPQHRIESAIWLMRGHDIGGLPVLEGSELVGMLLYKHLLGVDMSRCVEEVMDRNVVVASASMSLRRAAELMTREKINRLPIVDDQSRLIGIVTYGDLLAELRQSADPITELPWSDSVHEWAIEELQRGREITVLFLDVNDFGDFNKLYGHVVGDTVLRGVAGVLRNLADSGLDSVCRYGGDEFCIATLRSAEQAETLASRIEQQVGGLRIPEAQDQTVTVAIGMRGGRRTREREHVHYTATLNNLINLASQDCIQKKAERKAKAIRLSSDSLSPAYAPSASSELRLALQTAGSGTRAGGRARGDLAEPSAVVQARIVPGGRGERLRLAHLEVSTTGEIWHVRVGLEPERGDGEDRNALSLVAYSSDLSRATDAEGALLLVAEATAAAARRALPEGHDLRIEEALRLNTTDGKELVTVIGQFQRPDATQPFAGSMPVDSDVHYAVASAALAAINHSLEAVPARTDEMAAVR
jgi:diguanylate cyclase (GGDEF)-like protein